MANYKGRPRVKNKRKYQIILRFTKPEIDIINAAVNSQGIPKAIFARNAVFEKAKKISK